MTNLQRLCHKIRRVAAIIQGDRKGAPVPYTNHKHPGRPQGCARTLHERNALRIGYGRGLSPPWMHPYRITLMIF